MWGSLMLTPIIILYFYCYEQSMYELEPLRFIIIIIILLILIINNRDNFKILVLVKTTHYYGRLQVNIKLW